MNDTQFNKLMTRLDKIDLSLEKLCGLSERAMEEGILMRSPASGMFSATSTEDVSDVMSSIRDGLFGVASSQDDEDTMDGLQSLIAQLTEAKTKLNEIGASMSASTDAQPNAGEK
tara:strand:+ start:770 stop:1114 length:345 start_codon:yes stop_codon:yes gene_type:complete